MSKYRIVKANGSYKIQQLTEFASNNTWHYYEENYQKLESAERVIKRLQELDHPLVIKTYGD